MDVGVVDCAGRLDRLNAAAPVGECEVDRAGVESGEGAAAEDEEEEEEEESAIPPATEADSAPCPLRSVDPSVSLPRMADDEVAPVGGRGGERHGGRARFDPILVPLARLQQWLRTIEGLGGSCSHMSARCCVVLY